MMADWRDVPLVDGYNMIGGWPYLAKLANSGMHEARDIFAGEISGLPGVLRPQSRGDFDAYRVPGLGKSYTQGKVQVFYEGERNRR